MHPLDVISYAYVDSLADKFGWNRDFGPTLARSVASVVLPSGSPHEPFRVDELRRLHLELGWRQWRGRRRPQAEIDRELFHPEWRAPNAYICEAMLIVAMREGQREARPMPKGETPLIPRFNYWFDPESGFAHPVARCVGAGRDPWTDDLFDLALDPFTGEKFTIFGGRGLRSPDRTPIGWRGSSYYYLG